MTTIGKDIDQAYMRRLETLILDPQVVREAKSLRIIYTPLHGTGSVIIKPMLTRLGFNFRVVPEQDCFDGRFPTVKSPNPEYGEALTMAIQLAEPENADLVVATDPDCDRMGVAVRTKDGKMKLLTGNQIGSLLAWYRIKTLFDKGCAESAKRTARGDHQNFCHHRFAKCDRRSLWCSLCRDVDGLQVHRRQAGEVRARRFLNNCAAAMPILPKMRRAGFDLHHSSLYVYGGEESYGYSGADFVRDKDGNGAVIMFCEVAAYAKSRGKRWINCSTKYIRSSVTLRKKPIRSFLRARKARTKLRV